VAWEASWRRPGDGLEYVLGRSWAVLGRLEVVLVRSLSDLGKKSWGGLGRSLGGLGAVLTRSWAVLNDLGQWALLG